MARNETPFFITTEGFTFQPGSESPDPDIENCQVIGFAKGNSLEEAFESLIGQGSKHQEIVDLLGFC